eukprot:TRINITY_DN12424_c0_g2_i1.p1 TRINITY_DN12424_c0_g2~~TRINITY_DN12424_c0_g2_i1.p1  ORF type:complete len:116 (-),score=13.96 TRINITY_DN12424_c0_g2_i1:228-575(-)
MRPGCKLSTGFWKKYRRTCARVISESEASTVQNQGQRGKEERVCQVSRIPKNSWINRSTDHAKHAGLAHLGSFSSIASIVAPDESFDSIDSTKSVDFDDGFVLLCVGDTLVEKSR